MSGGSLSNLLGPLTEPISGDEYVRVVLVQRQEAWLRAHPSARPGFPPLLEWFIEARDEEFVQLPESEPAPKKERKPRVYRSAESLREELAEVERRMAAVAGAGDCGDGAVVNLSPFARSRAARVAGRKRFEQMDRALEKYGRLRRRRDGLRCRIAAAEKREAS